ncbi:MAG: hypothetical protein AAF497_27135, partial [Planctomycetota bacterium]
NTFFSGIGLLASTIDNTPVFGQIPGVDQVSGGIAGILGAATGWAGDGTFGVDDGASLAFGIANFLNPEPVSQTIIDIAGFQASLAGFGTSAAQTGAAGANLVNTLGDATDWTETLGDITARAQLWAENFGKMLDGSERIYTVIDNLAGQSTSDPAIIAELNSAVAQILDGYSYFEGIGIAEELRAVSERYENWMDHFEQVYAGFFEGGDEIPYLVTDRDGNFVTRGVSDADGTFTVVLPANEVFNFTVVDPLRGWGITQIVVTGDNGTQQTRTALLMPTDIVDTDMDGLSDIVEDVLGTNRNNPDSDGDGVNDGGEVRQGLDPLDARGFPTGVISSLPLQGRASDVVTVSDPNNAEDILAYVATGSAGLSIMDISQFDDPIQLGQIDLAGVNQGVAVNVDRTLAAVAGGNGGLHVVDISEPMTPELVRTESLGGSVSTVEINNGLIYAASGANLYAIDLVSGEQIEMLNIGANITDISRDGNMLFTMDSAKKLTAIDVSAFAMVSRGALILPNGGGKLFVGGGIAYASNPLSFRGGFSTVDVSDPTALTLISDIDVPVGVDSVEGP